MKITKEYLEKLYRENDNKIVCENLGITQVTLVSYLNHYGIKLKGKGNKKSQTKITLK